MATVTGFTSARMLEIENGTVVDGNIVGGHLILETRGGTEIDAGSVAGPTGATGPQGPPGTPGERVDVGMLADFPKLPLPTGWLACDGTLKNIADHPDLAAYLGTSFGGDGVTTFGLPNYAGLVRVGRDPGQAEFDTVGEAGGEKAHVLTVAELAIHSHPDTLAAPAHVHPMPHSHEPSGAPDFWVSKAGGFNVGSGSGPLGTAPSTAGVSTPNTGGASATALTGGVGNTGSNGAHNNLQPYRVVITAIKT